MISPRHPDRLPALVVSLWLGVAGGAWAADDNAEPEWPVVIARLRQEMAQRPGHADTRHQLAVAYNNYGVTLGKQGQWGLAEEQLQEAMKIDAANRQFRENLSYLYLNQAHAAYQQHRVADATSAIEKALSFNPTLAPAYHLRGDLEYDRQNLKHAKTAWQRSLELDPSQPELAKRLEQLSRELPVESKFERLSQAYFDLRYEEQGERPVGFDVRDALLEARRLVGSDFAYWPKQKIVVLIYSAKSFRALRDETPDWVAGQFDGKIRVPLPDAQLDPSMVKQILFHEYTHALVHDLANDRCPIWLNEGLAEYEGARSRAARLPHLAAASRANRLIPWSALSDQFSTVLPVDAVALGYQQSASIVHFLVQRYGLWRIRRLLKAIGQGAPWEHALATEYRIKLPRLEANWREWLPELLEEHPTRR